MFTKQSVPNTVDTIIVSIWYRMYKFATQRVEHQDTLFLACCQQQRSAMQKNINDQFQPSAVNIKLTILIFIYTYNYIRIFAKKNQKQS